MKKQTLTALVAALALATAPAAQAGSVHEHTGHWKYPIYAGDALLTRPLMLGVTVLGAGLYVASLPFTFLAPRSDAFGVLVADPARATFTRCLGCPLPEDLP